MFLKYKIASLKISYYPGRKNQQIHFLSQNKIIVKLSQEVTLNFILITSWWLVKIGFRIAGGILRYLDIIMQKYQLTLEQRISKFQDIQKHFIAFLGV